MKIIVKENYHELSKYTAELITSQIVLKPDSTLGFATGSTPELTYKYLLDIYNTGRISFKEITSFNLDEYVGLSKDNVNSYNYYMNEKLFNHVDIKKENINIPNGNNDKLLEECIIYENKIDMVGGIDLQLLGIGRNCHIGFNEPNVKFEATTHVVKLDEDTINANARFFDSYDEVPRSAISMGIKSIIKSKRIIIIAYGEEKAVAIRDMVEGKITPANPASILQLHENVTVVLDKQASKLLCKLKG